MIKKIFTILLFLFALNFALAIIPLPAHADNGLPTIKSPFDNLQIKIPGLDKLTDAKECPNDPGKLCFSWIGEYIVGIYKYAIGIAGILATIVMMIGGFMWLIAGGNQSRISEAKAWIGASLTGLIIALSSYLILYQVNPNLVKFEALKIAWVKPSEEKASKISIGTLSDKDARNKLNENGILVKNNLCTGTDPYSGKPYAKNGCTSLEGIPQSAINGLINLKNTCSDCSVFITGGTEFGHTTHGPGVANIDLKISNTNLNNFLTTPIVGSNYSVADQTPYLIKEKKAIFSEAYLVTINGQSAFYYKEDIRPKNAPSSWAPHWHVEYK